MTVLRFLIAALLSLAVSANAASDKTDLWYIPSESGWGMTIANQDTTIFVTMYVYDASNNPTWFVGTATLTSTNPQGVGTYNGDWYRVTGPFYGGAVFNPSAVNATKVGVYTFRELSATTGEITYSVNGVGYLKIVQRQTLAINNNVYGSFGGAYFSNISGCSGSGSLSLFMTMDVTGTTTATTLAMQFPDTGTSCTMTAPYIQSGRFGSIAGSWKCSNGITATMTISELEANGRTLSGRINASYSGCTEVGYFGTGRLLP